MKRLLVGLDPGVSTGLAAWDLSGRRLDVVSTVLIHQAMRQVECWATTPGLLAGVIFEDARQRTWFAAADGRAQRSGAGIREGVGSVKRDCGIWQDFLASLGVMFEPVKPAAGATKWTAEQFCRATGWVGRTSEHARDAALLVYGMTEAQWTARTKTIR